jgi:hypothetical protein
MANSGRDKNAWGWREVGEENVREDSEHAGLTLRLGNNAYETVRYEVVWIKDATGKVHHVGG